MDLSGRHLRCHIEYEKGFDSYAKTLVKVVKPVTEMQSVERFYFFWQDYSDRFERHVQLDLFVDQSSDVETIKRNIESKIEKEDREFYWEEEFVSTWYGLNQKEKNLLLETRVRNAEISLETLEAYLEGEIEHRPEQLVNRNYHVIANQNGMTLLDEFKFCLTRIIQIPLIKIFDIAGVGESIYNRIFLKKELDNL